MLFVVSEQANNVYCGSEPEAMREPTIILFRSLLVTGNSQSIREEISLNLNSSSDRKRMINAIHMIIQFYQFTMITNRLGS